MFGPSLFSSLIHSWTKSWKACLRFLALDLVIGPLGIMILFPSDPSQSYVVFKPCSSPCGCCSWPNPPWSLLGQLLPLWFPFRQPKPWYPWLKGPCRLYLLSDSPSCDFLGLKGVHAALVQAWMIQIMMVRMVPWMVQAVMVLISKWHGKFLNKCRTTRGIGYYWSHTSK